MDVEAENVPVPAIVEEDSLILHEQEIEEMVAVDTEDEQDILPEQQMRAKPVRVWPEVDTAKATKFRTEIDDIREVFQDEIDEEDTTMVSEYANEIFEYMTELEVRSPSYPSSLVQS